MYFYTPFSCSGCDVGTSYSGRRLADALMQCSSSRLPPSVHREGEVDGDGDGGVDVVEQLAQSALSLLFASSHSAKQAALDGGTYTHTHNTHITHVFHPIFLITSWSCRIYNGTYGVFAHKVTSALSGSA